MSDQAAPKKWTAPETDQEFEYTGDNASLPDWLDKSWASSSNGAPALAVPHGPVPFGQPYTTDTARPGDTIKFVAAKPGAAGHFIIEPGVPDADAKPNAGVAQQSAASLEDQLIGGLIEAGDLSDSEKAAVRSGPHPELLPDEQTPQA